LNRSGTGLGIGIGVEIGFGVERIGQRGYSVRKAPNIFGGAEVESDCDRDTDSDPDSDHPEGWTIRTAAGYTLS
jgi:hypothetical protein